MASAKYKKELKWEKVFKSGLSKFSKGCLPQNLLHLLLNNLSHISITGKMWKSLQQSFLLFNHILSMSSTYQIISSILSSTCLVLRVSIYGKGHVRGSSYWPLLTGLCHFFPLVNSFLIRVLHEVLLPRGVCYSVCPLLECFSLLVHQK